MSSLLCLKKNWQCHERAVKDQLKCRQNFAIFSIFYNLFTVCILPHAAFKYFYDIIPFYKGS